MMGKFQGGGARFPGDMAVVVLGNKLESEEVHPELRGRMDVGIDVFRDSGADHLILTGGMVNEDVPLAEAEAMRNYAVEEGVDLSDVRMETRAMDTIQNGIYVRRILDHLHDVRTVHVVSSCYHMRRARFIFEQCLGAGYEIDASNCYEADKHPSELYEDEAMEATREFFEPFAPGDVDGIEAGYWEAVEEEEAESEVEA